MQNTFFHGLKGLCQEMNIFKGHLTLYQLLVHFLYWEPIVLTFSASLMKRQIETNIKVLLSSMKTISNLNSEDCSKSRIKISVTASFPAIGRFSPVFSLIGCRKIKVCENVHFIGGFQNNLQDHRRISEQLFRSIGGYQKTGRSSLKRVSIRIFRISKWFHRNYQKLPV